MSDLFEQNLRDIFSERASQIDPAASARLRAINYRPRRRCRRCRRCQLCRRCWRRRRPSRYRRDAPRSGEFGFYYPCDLAHLGQKLFDRGMQRHRGSDERASNSSSASRCEVEQYAKYARPAAEASMGTRNPAL